MRPADTSAAWMEVNRLEAENTRLRARFEQIALVCTENMDRNCDHRMALDFVRQIANDPLVCGDDPEQQGKDCQ